MCSIAIALNAKNSLKNREQLTTTIKQSAEDEPSDKQQTSQKQTAMRGRIDSFDGRDMDGRQLKWEGHTYRGGSAGYAHKPNCN